jgi:hypothetical protein
MYKSIASKEAEQMSQNYANVRRFLNIPTPWHYDFKDENDGHAKNVYREDRGRAEEFTKSFCSNNGSKVNMGKLYEKVLTGTDSLSKLIRYKYNAAIEGSSGFDCDSWNGTCELTNEIFELLFPFAKKKSNKGVYEIEMDSKPIEFGPDTMNSFKTTYNQAKVIYENEEKDSHLYASIGENAELQKFARLTHSIGNFTLIPRRHDSLKSIMQEHTFNQYRGTSEDLKDYWDLSLRFLKENYFTFTDGKETFEEYAEKFYLKNDGECKSYIRSDGEIRPLFAGHELSEGGKPYSVLPENENELIEFLETVNSAIISRGEKMVRELEKKLKEKSVDK